MNINLGIYFIAEKQYIYIYIYTNPVENRESIISNYMRTHTNTLHVKYT